MFGKSDGYAVVPDESEIEMQLTQTNQGLASSKDKDRSPHQSSLREIIQHNDISSYTLRFFPFIFKCMCVLLLAWILPHMLYNWVHSSIPAAAVDDAIIPDVSPSQAFDKLGRFILRNYDKAKPMANFLAGVGGMWGIPMWVFYVNRGQGIASFGLQNKDGGIAGFQTAEKAYQTTPYTGFRTFVRGERASGQCFAHQPFFPGGRFEAKAGEGDIDSDIIETLGEAGRDMHIGLNEMEIVERIPSLGLTTTVLYYTVPNQKFPALIRKTSFTNTGEDSIDLDVLDGLGKLYPSGLTYAAMNGMGRTLEAWMKVFNVGSGTGGHISQPFFHITQGFADTSTVTLIKAGHFAVSYVEESENLGADGLYTPLGYIVDPNVVYGWDTSLMNPQGFFGNPSPVADKNNGTDDDMASSGTLWSMNNFLLQSQGTTSRTPCAFAGATKRNLAPGETFAITTVIGHSPDLDTFITKISPVVRTPGFSKRAHEANAEVMTGVTDGVSTVTANHVFDDYVRQDYLDNVLRGGLPLLLDGSNGNRRRALLNDIPLPESSTSTNVDTPVPKVFHTFSRIHGDLERDYNDFLIDTTYLSQGPGNFRDVCQNRRLDTLMNPQVGSFNVHNFLAFIQADGYNPLTVASTNFRISPEKVETVLDELGVIDPGKIGLRGAVKKLLTASWRPGKLFSDFDQLGLTFLHSKEKLLPLLIDSADQYYAAQFAQNGFWTDHWTYLQDLLDTYLQVFPDKEQHLLWDSQKVPFYFSPAIVKPRTSRYSLVPNPNLPGTNTLRVLSAVYVATDADYPAKRNAEYLSLWKDNKQYVGDATGAGALWQRTENGKHVFSVSVITKFTMLALLKFGTMDPRGMGVEMEGGKPGWNDAMNGLPGLLGSGMPETYEALRMITYLHDKVQQYNRPVDFPEEYASYLAALSSALDSYDKEQSSTSSASTDSSSTSTSGAADMAYWSACADAREAYRNKILVHFSGVVVSMPADDLVLLLSRAIDKLNIGITKALATVSTPNSIVGTIVAADNSASTSGKTSGTVPVSADNSASGDGPVNISPTYFWYECVAYESDPSALSIAKSSGSAAMSAAANPGPANVLPTAFVTHTLPFFLEGPTRHLKTLKTVDEKRAVYLAVRSSPLYDQALKMYTLSASLVNVGPEVGRMVAFTPGWLENQSVWLHMSYKFYLELLRGELYHEFYAEIATGMVPFMDTAVYGRSSLEAASFIVSSAFPDPKLRGGSYLARLSGSTAEMLSIWASMFIGQSPFRYSPASADAEDAKKSEGELTLEFHPALPGWMFKQLGPSSSDLSSHLSHSHSSASSASASAFASKSTGDSVVSFTFLGKTNVTYHNKLREDTWKLNVTTIVLIKGQGQGKHHGTASVHVDGGIIRGELALLVREGGVTAIDVYF